MRRLPVLLIGFAAALAAALIANAGSTGKTAFRTPDAGAACKVSGLSLVCSSLGSPGSVELRGRGGAQVVSRLPWWDASTPVLHTWHHGAISCRLAGNAILCRNDSTAIRITAAGLSVAS
ncbi:MAG: hypothetical protein JWO17_2214 [Actinomycetia bacterium]|nr:hypothetical protein [Actinomycetes bacterium]